MLYWLGVGDDQKVEAEFTLSPGPVLILVDDPEERLTWGPARDQIAEGLAKILLENQGTQKIISPETLNRHRRTQADFDSLSCAQIGRLVGAEQVLWLEVKSFVAEEEIHDMTDAGALSVSVRVINPNEQKDREKVRLWPTEREGKSVAVGLSASEATRLKTKEAIAGELAAKLSKEVAKLFYKHPLKEEEEEKKK